MNGVKLQEAGMAEAMRQHLLTADNARELLFHMLNPSTAEPYRAAARKMQALVRAIDRTNTAAAANMLEFFAQYGWDHLVPAGDKMPWYKANDADLNAAVATVVLLLLAAVLALVRSVVLAIARKAGINSSSNSDGQKSACSREGTATYHVKAKAA
jgi:hypothetical protein